MTNETTNEHEVLLLRRKLDLLLRTGKMLMESAADTNRIERNMKRVAAYLGIPEDKLHIDIRWTMLMVNVSDEKHSFSKFQKCEKHGINMEAISKISKLSWRAIEQDYSLDKYEEELEKIAHQKLCTFVGFRTRARCIEFGINVYMSIAISAFVCTCLAYAFSFTGWSVTPYHPLLACTLYIVPGVPLINFVDDMIDNHLLVGITRAANTVMMVGGMAIAVCTRNFVNFELGYGPVIGSFMGSFVVSLLAVKAVHWFHVPNHVLTIPSVIPMVPGVLMYRSLLAFINMHGVIGEVTNAFSNGINSALIILCISLGVAVPNIFARRYIAKDRREFLQKELEERKARGKFIEW